VTLCADCGTRLQPGQLRVYVPEREPADEVAIALCVGCAVRKPSTKLYTPTGVPDRSRTDLSERGRA
jgi:hypothetical protein